MFYFHFFEVHSFAPLAFHSPGAEGLGEVFLSAWRSSGRPTGFAFRCVATFGRLFCLLEMAIWLLRKTGGVAPYCSPRMQMAALDKGQARPPFPLPLLFTSLSGCTEGGGIFANIQCDIGLSFMPSKTLLTEHK